MCHASTRNTWRARGVRSTCYRSGNRSTIVTLEVAAPLAMALDGDAVILTQAAVLEFGVDGARAAIGVHECVADR
jgi:hypothetical protein